MRLLFWTTTSLLLLISFFTFVSTGSFATETAIPQDAARDFFTRHAGPEKTSNHTNNWAVLVCSSRYWFNYRHMANALGMYRTVKRLGIPDSNIILMLADDVACNARNKFPATVFSNQGRSLDLYGENIEVDYRGYEVTVENFIRVLTGRMDSSVPRSKRLLTDDRSNVFVYMTGHGGNEFLKFQDNEEISAFDIADAFEQMWQKKRYNEIFFMIDTCQANSMFSKIYSPNILATGSSEVGENSYSYENDNDVGVAVIDTFTHYVLQFMEGINKTSQLTMQDLFNTFSFDKIKSTPGVRSDLFGRPLDRTLITDFLGGVAQVELVDEDASAEEPSFSADNFSEPESPSDEILLAVEAELRSGNNISRGDRTPTTATNVDSSWYGLVKVLRAWGSAAVVGGLIGWIVTSR
ncbi:hypothetical protein GLOTRDRAFT_80198 [Gloeophyllum trabeum ATCC 11539]|uniref:GPI-anchor transamidase n=1 Tax=Gloeophyllum trabeum (strain ATCC 11539 / FP-39264 / Madison 617) TaxID=670483 RepID=S7RCX1_GLOTA|nr:uncharacterized protein GLOTRDRAFT_80198 [Gloeophyllum trabeum ATCC 11539]EPQ52040.1 hypothetical protein GLOTRDRAFT_80198 [Gloeophyllum trabeum ATCC 11539]